MVMFILLVKFSSMVNHIEGLHLYDDICLLDCCKSRHENIGNVLKLIFVNVLNMEEIVIIVF